MKYSTEYIYILAFVACKILVMSKISANKLALLLFSWRMGEGKILHFLYKVLLLHIHCKSVTMFWLEKNWEQTRWITGNAMETVLFPLTHFYSFHDLKQKQNSQDNLLQKMIIFGNLSRKATWHPSIARRLFKLYYCC